MSDTNWLLPGRADYRELLLKWVKTPYAPAPGDLVVIEKKKFEVYNYSRCSKKGARRAMDGCVKYDGYPCATFLVSPEGRVTVAPMAGREMVFSMLREWADNLPGCSIYQRDYWKVGMLISPSVEVPWHEIDGSMSLEKLIVLYMAYRSLQATVSRHKRKTAFVGGDAGDTQPCYMTFVEEINSMRAVLESIFKVVVSVQEVLEKPFYYNQSAGVDQKKSSQECGCC